MKLFGWMHTKFRQDSSDGSACNCLSRCHQFSPLAPARISQPAINFPSMSEKEFVLESLLAIGTLGLSSSEPIMEESTPMAELEEPADANVEAIAEKEETEVATETDLMVINAELEKVLLAELADKEGDSLSSARPSHAGKASTECPLQDYLFGATVEGCTTEKKEKRASLGELFLIEEGEEGAKLANGLNGGATKESRRESAGVHVTMKRMLSRRKSTPRSSSTSYADGNTTDKFSKVLQIFHKKVHPENNTASKKYTKQTSKQRNKGNPAMSYIGHCFIAGGSKNEPEIKTESTFGSEHVASVKPDQDPTSLSLGKSDSMGSREYWIKTDVDYLVLEL